MSSSTLAAAQTTIRGGYLTDSERQYINEMRAIAPVRIVFDVYPTPSTGTWFAVCYRLCDMHRLAVSREFSGGSRLTALRSLHKKLQRMSLAKFTR